MISSENSENIKFPIIYAFVENEAFCCEKIIPSKSTITHIVHVRYGGGYGGGGNASGVWLLKVLNQLHCELFITDNHLEWQDGDSFAVNQYDYIRNGTEAKLKSIRTIDGERWGNHGDVSWKLIV